MYIKNTVIFDLDGTLLDTLADLTASVNHAMELYGFPCHTKEQVREMVGNGVYVLMEQAVPGGRGNPCYDACIREFQKHYQTHMQDNTAPFPGILPLLQELRQKGFSLAVVSNKFDAAVKALCADYFSPYIRTAIGESAAAKRKPAPDTVFLAMDSLQVTPDQCIYVGDSEVDLATAENAGIPCISVSWGFKSAAFLKARGAQRIAADTAELLSYIEELSC